jgi:hypothetical protein
MVTIRIADQFSDVPAGRYRTDGQFSGERFRDEFLVPALAKEDEVTVEIDGVAGYGSSFLEEAFGGLVRLRHFSAEQLKRKLKIVSRDPSFGSYRAAIWHFIDQSRPETSHGR